MKPEIITKSIDTPCKFCEGKGAELVFNNPKTKQRGYKVGKPCPKCNGTGKYKIENHILVATNSKGQKIGFTVDQEGK